MNAGATIGTVNQKLETPYGICSVSLLGVSLAMEKHKEQYVCSMESIERSLPKISSEEFMRHCFSCSHSGDDVFLFGGWDGQEGSPSFKRGILKLKLSNLSMSTIDAHNDDDGPASLSDATTAIHGDRLFVFGGITSSRKSNSNVWMLNLKTLLWKAVNTIRPPLAIYGQKTFLVQDSVYFFAANNSVKWNEVHMFNLNTLEWTITKTNAGPPIRVHHSVNALISATGNKGKGWKSLIIFGGKQKNGDIMSDIWKFNLETNSWECLSPTGCFPCARYRHAAVLEDGTMYIHGGKNKFGSLLGDIMAFDFVQNMWYECYSPSLLAPRFGHSLLFLSPKKLMILGGCSVPKVVELTLGATPQRPTAQLAVPTSKSPRAIRRSSSSDVKHESPVERASSLKPRSPDGNITGVNSAQIISYVNLVQSYLAAPTPDLKIKIGIKGNILLQQLTNSGPPPSSPTPITKKKSSAKLAIPATINSIARQNLTSMHVTKVTVSSKHGHIFTSFFKVVLYLPHSIR